METRQQGSTLFSAVLVLIAMLVVIQLWLVAAALDALLARQIGRARADRHRVGRAVRVERRPAVVRRVVRRAAAPLEPRVADRAGGAGRSSSTIRRSRASLVARLQIAHLLTRYSERHVWALFMFLNGFVTIALLAAVAMVSRTPFVFPSLGPTAFLFFFTPRAPAASPRHTIYGHAIGIVCGYGALWLFGLQHAPPAMATGVSAARVGAAALSLASTGALMILAESGAPARRRDDPHHLARDRDADRSTCS